MKCKLSTLRLPFLNVFTLSSLIYFSTQQSKIIILLQYTFNAKINDNRSNSVSPGCWPKLHPPTPTLHTHLIYADVRTSLSVAKWKEGLLVIIGHQHP
jgi:hypothetical protein